MHERTFEKLQPLVSIGIRLAALLWSSQLTRTAVQTLYDRFDFEGRMATKSYSCPMSLSVCVCVHACREFVVSIISDWFIEAANHTCGPYSPEQNEFDSSGLTQVPSLLVSWQTSTRHPQNVLPSSFHRKPFLCVHTDVPMPKRLPLPQVAPPRVGESAVNMECKLRHTYDVKNS